jgi:2-polyprenyl-6-methoxyphenol hydroxylase-like FAD-dependent oxidoreductase
MTTQSLDVLIIGAGPGGLCLAQGLAASGIGVRVFERDRSPSERVEGYRLGINATGSEALRACLPAARFEALRARSARPSEAVTFLDQRLGKLLDVEIGASASASDHPVSRNVLRRVLLEGLEERVSFGKKLVAFEAAPGPSVRAVFEDGTSATGTLLVGADGASSRVRQQLLPHARRVETGIEIVTGKFALSDGVRARTPPAIWRGPTLVLGPHGRFLFANAVEYPPDEALRRYGAPVAATPGAAPEDDREEYVMWGFSTWREAFPAPGVQTLDPPALKSTVLGLMTGWHPKLRQLIQSAEPSSLSAFPAKTSVPIAPWQTSHVTLLGDALHNMTPYRGVGANTALWDAALLTRTLLDVRDGRAPLLDAVARYERQMIEHGFAAVRASQQEMRRLHHKSLLGRLATKTLFRAADRVGPLKALFQAAS